MSQCFLWEEFEPGVNVHQTILCVAQNYRCLKFYNIVDRPSIPQLEQSNPYITGPLLTEILPNWIWMQSLGGLNLFNRIRSSICHTVLTVETTSRYSVLLWMVRTRKS